MDSARTHLRGWLCVGLLLGSAAAAAEISYSGEQRNAATGFGSSAATSERQRHAGEPRRERTERHLRHPLQTTPNRHRDYDRDRARDDFRDGYRDGYRSGFRDRDWRDGGYYSPYGQRRHGYDGARRGYGYGHHTPRDGFQPYGYSPYSGGAPGYSPPPVRRYPSVPQPLSPYRR